jgi:hypothetical protein
VSEPWWVAEPGTLTPGQPVAHALVVGVSRYDYLAGGSGAPTTEAVLAGLGQLSAAATSAGRVAEWLRERYEYPEATQPPMPWRPTWRRPLRRGATLAGPTRAT